MMIGEKSRPHPTIHIPLWDPINDPTATMSSALSDSLAPLYRYLPSNEFANDSDESLVDSFRMYEFKVRGCARGRSHDWTECPFAHPGEKARRRDPRKYHYSGAACSEFRKGSCRKGESCEFAHGVFECWLHPARYRTQPCKDGTSCRRRICFFAHTPEQLRVLPASVVATSPTSILVSPPRSPPSESGLGLPFSSSLRPRFNSSTPTTPCQGRTWPVLREFDVWDNAREEVPAMELVESGKELRARMYARLSRENSLG